MLLALGMRCIAQSPTHNSTAPNAVSAQPVDEQTGKDRSYAMDLYQRGKCLEAVPWLEKIISKLPNDPAIHEALGSCLVAKAATLPDAAQRKATRVQARQEFLKAKELGDNSDYLNLGLASLPEDGHDPQYADNAEVDRLMRQAEAAFAAGNLDDAKKSYLQVLVIDPNNYTALLFMGDVYFRKGDATAAGEWFSRAIAVDPTQESAYRYWGDSLMKQGKVTEAGDKFVEAFIAEPYNRLARAGFVNWGERVNLSLAHPRVEFPASVNKKGENGTTITLDPTMLDKGDKDGSSAAWMVYSFTRASWATSEFAKQYPDEKAYRHSLKEEATAIRAALKSLDEKKSATGDHSLQILKKLDQDGLLEAFILLAMPDAGIANDFAGYRKTNTENLRRYVKQYVMTGGGQ